MAKRKRTALEEMHRAALANHTTYAELQIRETLRELPQIPPVPKHYKKAGEWRKEKESHGTEAGKGVIG